MLKNLNVALYVCGSISNYKSLSLLRLLKKNGANVKVIMTKNAQMFVSALAFQTLSKNKVYTELTQEFTPEEINHIEIGQWADLSIIAPASANFIAKMANGIADDAASSTLLATKGKKIIVPAMNDNMWFNPATVRNIKQLKKDGNIVISPDSGELAEGYSGKGRMPEPEAILEFIIGNKNNHKLNGKHFVVTAGGTREPIDPVRYITNKSSGKMGYAIARSLIKQGCDVTLISAPTSLEIPKAVKYVPVQSSSDMEKAVLNHFKKADGLIMSAAVSDFKVAKVANQKIKKTSSDDFELHLIKTHDILKEVAKIKQNHQITVGFAAETENLIDNASKKLRTKKLDLLIANDVSREDVGFNSDFNQVTVINDDNTKIAIQKSTKEEIADQIVQIICKKINK
ncbi:bifunctional phosphopantothenoylcysteine decarboxylase/phosphopantothenate--cysteine ligase CoaBC [Apilactobacillus ozensis]|uniref:Coenzyme A biosynthesis bifunctional protein CoaBC n=1 Tax=Apilactobacillus ozensis DSM 23829 = JCM 17196 TaxID=1423781 RepID=A0A0R2ALL9_9LACO|nr:bifunctional phosphopantothenoylcysteine decarboxylase/phosphopantothenate--cysteine ligase CoaBC [Apilactobacillus ozensis]KRM68065.1 phosphopantothenoylcysteine decarboxylase phosphopantothenate cysteine ligase [Apilactobacillus ozensis DSM 23829 = JCM 17196]MCK8606570.1 bifunctional phosphopantothenoylcysteine decarboxylase/phosphopantothenate--cysteine ligase CoaBC [Apilactobacillus ozensis]